MASKLQLTLILDEYTLYFIVKGNATTFDLRQYSFNAHKNIAVGEDGNHLFGKTGPLQDMRATFIRSVSKTDRLKIRLGLMPVTGVFITRRMLDNLAVKHYCDLLQQLYCKTAAVYYDDNLSLANTLFSADQLAQYTTDNKMIGKVTESSSGYWYKKRDNSIEDTNILRDGRS